MARRCAVTGFVVLFAAIQAGCVTLPRASDSSPCHPADAKTINQIVSDVPEKKDEESPKPSKEEEPSKTPKKEKPPKTLFEWRIGKEEKTNGQESAEEEEDRIVTDRPDFTEASSTVGRGRIQLESGYTYIRDRSAGTTTRTHSYPEALFRIGMFADWFELRIGQNFGTQSTTEDGTSDSASGADDLYLGVKLGLTEQKKALPETALILQMTVPTGIQDFSADEVHPGFNFLFGWDIIKDCLSLGGSFQMNRASSVIHVGFPPTLPFPGNVGDVNHSFLEVAQSLTVGYELTQKLGAYTEWFAIYPHSSQDPDVLPEYYLNGGFTYLVNNNFQLDIRAGFGLNDHADDFFTGAGFAVRY